MVSKLNDGKTEYYFFNNGIFEVRGAAGAGKTYQLTQDIKNITSLHKRIAVISFSNAAVDELNSRLSNTDVVLSTIHSFCWNMIDPIALQIIKLIVNPEDFNLDGLDGTAIAEIKNVKYGKLGHGHFDDENKYLWLSHDDVISLFTCALEKIPSFAKLVNSSFDFILIDEYQDTKTEFLQALFNFVSDDTVIGLYGDPYQSIFLHKHSNELSSIQQNFVVHQYWLGCNYRSDKDLVKFFNVARSSYDGLVQEAVNEEPLVKRKIKVFTGNVRLSRTQVLKINKNMNFEESTILSNTNGLKTSITNFGDIARQLKNGIGGTPKIEWSEVLNIEQLNYRIKGLLTYSKVFFGSNYDKVVSLRSIFTDESILLLGLNHISNLIDVLKAKKTNDFQYFIKQGLEVESEYQKVISVLDSITYHELCNINDFYTNLENINNQSLTIYASKGLEFNNVILNIDWGNFPYRNWNDLNFYLRENDVSESNINLMSYLFYVGITRAKHGLAIYINVNEHPTFFKSFQEKFSQIDLDYQQLV